MPAAQQSVMNDNELSDFSLIMVQEPHCFLVDQDTVVATPIYHAQWTQILSSEHL
jgi:hypothetical protein